MSWVIGVCGIPLWEYLLLFVYPGTSLTLLRSFAEHRSHPDWEGRSAILEAEYLFGILYLYNNFFFIKKLLTIASKFIFNLLVSIFKVFISDID